MRPIAPGFSAADAGSERRCGHRRPPTLQHGRRSTRTRSSASGAACGLRRESARGHLLDAHRAIARRSARLADEYNNPATFERAARWRGRRPRSSYTISALILMRPTSSRSSPARSCTRTLRCGFIHGTHTQYPGPSALWRHGISGDMPIVLVRIDEPRGSGNCPTTPSRPRILADEAVGSRSRDPERTGPVLRSRSPGALWRPRSGPASRACGMRGMNRPEACLFCAEISFRLRIAPFSRPPRVLCSEPPRDPGRAGRTSAAIRGRFGSTGAAFSP